MKQGGSLCFWSLSENDFRISFDPFYADIADIADIADMLQEHRQQCLEKGGA